MRHRSGEVARGTTPAADVGPAFRRVLLWVNSPDRSDPALSVALLLARRGSGILHVVMGLDSPGRYRPVSEGRVEPLTPEVIERVCTALADLYGEAGGEAVEVHTMVLPGHPVEEVRRYARRHRVDVIVMGDQALDAEEDYGDHLLRDAPCPVVLFAQGPRLLSHLARKE